MNIIALKMFPKIIRNCHENGARFIFSFMYDAVLFIALRVALRPSTPSVYYNFNNTVNGICCKG